MRFRTAHRCHQPTCARLAHGNAERLLRLGPTARNSPSRRVGSLLLVTHQPVARQTATVLVYEQLKDDILAGRFSAGTEAQGPGAVRRDRNVNVNAMREALQPASPAKGLAEVRPRQGFAVMSFSRAARRRPHRGARRARAGPGRLVHRARRHRLGGGGRRQPTTPCRSPPTVRSRGSRADQRRVAEVRTRRFHAALLAGSGSPTGCAIAANLADISDVYRRWTLLGRLPKAATCRRGAPRALMDAAVARDAELAAYLLSPPLHPDGRTAA